MNKVTKNFVIVFVTLLLGVITFGFYIRPTPLSDVVDVFVGLFISSLFVASLLYWIYYGVKRLIKGKEKEFDPVERIHEIANKRSKLHS